MAASLLRRGAAAAGRRWCPVDVLRRLVSSEAAPERATSRAPPEMPPFDHQPRPYAGMGGAEIFEKRKALLGPSLFHYYQKPVKAPPECCLMVSVSVPSRLPPNCCFPRAMKLTFQKVRRFGEHVLIGLDPDHKAVSSLARFHFSRRINFPCVLIL